VNYERKARTISQQRPDTTAAILACLNLLTRAPPTEPASPEEEPVDSR
jgi:hypothetical protein